MWSFVQNKGNQRWLWLAINHDTGDILAYTFGNDWGSYQRNIDTISHKIGKRNTQTIERKNLTLRTRIKRLARKFICFSKSQEMHDIDIGLVINILDEGQKSYKVTNTIKKVTMFIGWIVTIFFYIIDEK